MKKNSKKILVVILAIAVVIGIVAASLLLKNQNINNNPEPNEEVTTNVYSSEHQEYDDNYLINDDYVGMIKFESGIIEEPFVQAHEDSMIDSYDKYLRTNWQTMEDDEEGTVFLDPSNIIDDQNLVLYGHYVYPSYEPSMTHKFTPLSLLTEKENYEKNKYFSLYLENEIRKYEIANVYYAKILDDPSNPIEKGMEYMFPSFEDEALKYYFDKVNEREFYDTGIEITPDDRFVTLQTCVENHDELRLIVIAKEISKEITR